MSEFRIIDWIRQRAGVGGAGIKLGIGDDAAVLEVELGHELVVSSDMLISGVHFHEDVPPEKLGHKSLAVNLSDLAAMGAKPRWVLLSISSGNKDQIWLEAFINGFLELAETTGVSLVGGDTCSGSLSISVTALGEVPQGQAIKRNGAQAGDLICVSGLLGEAALALGQLDTGKLTSDSCLEALYCPQARINLGQALRGLATSCIDISDGLLADLGHIAKASSCGAEIELDLLPASPELKACELAERWALQLSGGDDYELCFTLPAAQEAVLQRLQAELGLKLTVVGTMVEGTHCARRTARQA